MEIRKTTLQGIGKPQFVLGAGAAELVARVAVCLLLPSALAGGVVSAEAPQAAVYGLCVADPFAWMSADAVLCIPFIKNIMRENYDYLYGSGQKLRILNTEGQLLSIMRRRNLLLLDVLQPVI